MRRGRPPHPDLLTPREQEVLSLLREGFSNRQIAERLGISRAGAAYHVSEILSKLQVSSREEAAAWRPEEPVKRGRRVPMPAFLVTTLQRLLSGMVGKVAGGMLIGAAAVAMALLAFGVFEMSQRDASPADATATAQIQSSEATPEPEDGDGPLRSVSDGFVRRDLASGEVPSEEHGILFVDVATGVGELWTVPWATDWNIYEADASHRWLMMDGLTVERVIIADRGTGVSYEVDSDAWRVALGPTPEGYLLLEAPSGASSFAFINLDTAPLRSLHVFTLPERSPVGAAVVLGGGDLLLVGDYIVDLASGALSGVPGVELHGTYGMSRPTTDGGAVRLIGGPGPVGFTVYRHDSSGELRDSQAFDRVSLGPWGVIPSPDGRWLAWSASVPLGAPGFTAPWASMVIADLDSGEVALRALRAYAWLGIRSLEWLDDSSGLIVGTPSGFGILRPSEARIETLPFGDVRDFGPMPVPAPGDPQLFVFDGRLLDIRGELVGQKRTTSEWARGSGSSYGLNLAGDELRLIKRNPVPIDRITGPWAFSLPSKVERSPYSDVLRLRVETGGDGLNVRSLPGAGDEVLGTLPDSTLVTVTEGQGHQCRDCSAEWDPAEDRPSYEATWWIHVRADDGLEGWVSSEYLLWAD